MLRGFQPWLIKAEGESANVQTMAENDKVELNHIRHRLSWLIKADVWLICNQRLICTTFRLKLVKGLIWAEYLGELHIWSDGSVLDPEQTLKLID